MMINFGFATQSNSQDEIRCNNISSTEVNEKRQKWNEQHAQEWTESKISNHFSSSESPFIVLHMKWTDFNRLSDFLSFIADFATFFSFILAFWLSLSVIVNIYARIWSHEWKQETLTPLDTISNTMALVNVFATEYQIMR